MIAYALGVDNGSGERHKGKRLRSSLCLNVCKALCGSYTSALPFAVALELFHAASLVHDDIEDEDDFRRGRTTAWKKYGISPAINAGDALVILAERALIGSSLSHKKTLKLMQRLNDVFLHITEGQALDLSFENKRSVSDKEYFTMIQKKTALLFSAACEVGAFIGTNNKKIIREFAAFGLAFGIAFQINNELFAIWGTSRVTGKNRYGDIRKKKKTLPILYALETLPTTDKRKLRILYERTIMDDCTVAQVVRLLDRAGAYHYVQKKAMMYKQKALKILGKISLVEIKKKNMRTFVVNNIPENLKG